MLSSGTEHAAVTVDSESIPQDVASRKPSTNIAAAPAEIPAAKPSPGAVSAEPPSMSSSPTDSKPNKPSGAGGGGSPTLASASAKKKKKTLAKRPGHARQETEQAVE